MVVVARLVLGCRVTPPPRDVCNRRLVVVRVVLVVIVWALRDRFLISLGTRRQSSRDVRWQNELQCCLAASPTPQSLEMLPIGRDQGRTAAYLVASAVDY